MVMILVMLYFIGKMMREDPTLMDAIKDRDQWGKVWSFPEKLQPEKNTAILKPPPEEEEETPVEAED